MRTIVRASCLTTIACVSDPVVGDASVQDVSAPDTSATDSGGGMDSTVMDTGGQDVKADAPPPKNFSCGTPAVCDFGTQVCCYTSPNTSGSCTSFLADGGLPCVSQWHFQCSATNQCAQGEVCCASKGVNNNPWASVCKQTCQASMLFTVKVFCNSTSECVSGTCQAIGAGFPSGYKECK